jgi:thiol:disulfide interchange protein
LDFNWKSVTAAVLLAAGLAWSIGCDVTTAPTPATPRAGSTTDSAEGGLHFVRGYEAGVRVAMRENRPLLVFFTAQWCHYCHEMADETFTDPRVRQLAGRFVCVWVDADREAEVCQTLDVQAFPTVQFLSPRGAPLKRLVGKQEAAQLAYAMRATLHAVAGQVAPATIRR